LESPGFTVVALLTLALGIGVNTTAFTVLNRLLLQTSPYPEADRLVVVFSSLPQSYFLPVSPADYCDLRDQNSVFEYTTCHCPGPASLVESGKPAVRIWTMGVSVNFFRTLGIAPILGRDFTADEAARREPAAILSNHYWRQHFGGDPSVVGRTLRIDTKLVPIVGVMPPSLDDPLLWWGRRDLWTLDHTDINRNMRDRAWYYVTARLKPGVSVDQAGAELTALSARLAHDFPTTDAGKIFRVTSERKSRTDSTTVTLCWLTLAVTAAVLAIICVNLANLQLVRASARGREHAIRMALGCSRGRIIRLQLTESIVLSLTGGVLGLLVAKWGNLSAQKYLAGYYPVEFPLDLRVIAFAFGAAALSGVLFGVVPAWMATRADVNAALKQNARGTSSDRSRHSLRQFLIVAELALALTVLAGAGFFVVGMHRLLNRELGWRPDNLLTGELVLSGERYGELGDPRCYRFGEQLRTELLALPGVNQAVLAYSSPIWGYASGGATDGFAIEGQPPPPDGKTPQCHINAVTPQFFGALGMHLLRGRDFTDADNPGALNVAIVNQSLADKFCPGESPLGKRIGTSDAAHRDWREVVGVVNNTIAPYDLGPARVNFEVYRPFAQVPHRWINFIVHTSADPSIIKDDVRRAVAKLDPDVAVAWLETARDEIAKSLQIYSTVGRLLTQMAVFGLLLSALGIYGVIANVTAERTQEIGIRMALGAQTRDVLWLILRNGLRLAAVGTVVGLALTCVLLYVLGKVMPEVPGQNVWVVLCLSALLAAIAAFACWLPARRASAVNPIEALRAE
jgi:predicted permease